MGFSRKRLSDCKSCNLNAGVHQQISLPRSSFVPSVAVLCAGCLIPKARENTPTLTALHLTAVEQDYD